MSFDYGNIDSADCFLIDDMSTNSEPRRELRVSFSLEELDPEIWPQLPPELVTRIIHATDDPETLECWRLATLHNASMGRDVLRSKWKDTTIGEFDLVPEPGVDAKDACIKYWKLRKHKRPTKDRSKLGGIHNKHAPRNKALAHIKHLTLGFLFWHTRHENFYNQPNNVLYVPTGESLEYSLAHLKPHLRRVQRMTVDGRISQAMLDMITSMPSSQKTTSLTLRRCNVYGWFYYLDMKKKGPATVEDLDLEMLRQLPQLRHLEVTYLKVAEVDSLAKALPKLGSLQSLELGTESSHGPSPIVALLVRLVEDREAETAGKDGTVEATALWPTMKYVSFINREQNGLVGRRR